MMGQSRRCGRQRVVFRIGVALIFLVLYGGLTLPIGVAAAAPKLDIIFRTTPDGQNRTGPTRISFPTRKIGVGLVVDDGKGAQIWRTEDAGKTWQMISQPTTQGAARDLVMLDAQRGFLTGTEKGHPEYSLPYLMKTTDGGMTWQPVTPVPWEKDETFHGKSAQLIFFDDQKGWIIARRAIYETRDGGANWLKAVRLLDKGGTNIPLIVSPQIFYLAHAVGGSEGGMYKTTDGFATYSAVPIPKISRLIATGWPGSNPGTNDYLLAGGAGFLMYSTDSGTNWQDVSGVLPVKIADPNTTGQVIAVGTWGGQNALAWVTDPNYSNRGALLFSQDGGATWVDSGADIGRWGGGIIPYDRNGMILSGSTNGVGGFFGRFQFNEIGLSASSIEVSPGSGSKAADGQEYFEVTVTVRDKASGAPMPEVKVNLESDRPEDIILPATGYVLDKRGYPGVLTDGSGKAKFYVKSTKKGTAHLSAYVNLNQQVGGDGYTKLVDFK